MSIFEYVSYQYFLNDYIKSLPMRGHGTKSAIAEHLGIQTTYVSRVLSAKAHFSLEQAEKLTSFLGQTREESHYFMLLVQKERAGTLNLQKYFMEQIKEERKNQLNLKKRLGVKKSLSKEDQVIYFSSWIYSAVHVMLLIPQFQEKNSLAKALNFSLQKINDVLDFLISVGLAKQVENKFITGDAIIHLGQDSPMLSKHHINWRMQAINAIENESSDNIHYSSVVTISHEDAIKIKEILIKSISKCKKVIKDSSEEDVFGFSMDFFHLLQ